MKRIFLLAIAIALMSLSAASAQRVRVNAFGGVVVRDNGGHRNRGNDVFVNVNGNHGGGAVFVNSFGGFNNHRSTVFVQPSFFAPSFVPTQVFIAPQSPVFVSPTSIYGGYGVGGFSTFSTFNSCGRW